jgi:hypothetical protein
LDRAIGVIGGRNFFVFSIVSRPTLPADLTVHLVMDNYGTHKTPRVERWFARHPRYQLHFTMSVQLLSTAPQNTLIR